LAIPIVFGAAAAACSLITGVSSLQENGQDAGLSDGSGPGNEGGSDSGTRDVDDSGSRDAVADSAPCSVGSVALVQVQGNVDSTTMSNSVALTLSLPQNAGDYLAVGINYDPSCKEVAAVSDTAADKFSRFIKADGDPDGGAGLLETWGAADVAATTSATPNTITITFGAVCMGKNMKVIDYSGVDPVMPVADAVFQHGGPTEMPTATLTARAHDMLLAHTADQGQAIEAGVGWTLLLKDAWATIAQDQVAPAMGTYGVTYVRSKGENWGIQAVTLRCK
jgi:hypothetical protein